MRKACLFLGQSEARGIKVFPLTCGIICGFFTLYTNN